jgi:hypothetical protein
MSAAAPHASKGLVGTIVLIVLFGLISIGAAVNYSRPTLEEIAGTTRAALPKGTPLHQIDAYFTAKQIEHSYFYENNRVYAMVHWLRDSYPPVQWDAQIIITLDKDKRLDSMDIEAVGTGP